MVKNWSKVFMLLNLLTLIKTVDKIKKKKKTYLKTSEFKLNILNSIKFKIKIF